jgi:hypothetical protein
LLAECDRYVIALFADLVISLLGSCDRRPALDALTMLIAPVCGRSVMVTVAVMSLIRGRVPWSSSCARRSCR